MNVEKILENWLNANLPPPLINIKHVDYFIIVRVLLAFGFLTRDQIKNILCHNQRSFDEIANIRHILDCMGILVSYRDVEEILQGNRLRILKILYQLYLTFSNEQRLNFLRVVFDRRFCACGDDSTSERSNSLRSSTVNTIHDSKPSDRKYKNLIDYYRGRHERDVAKHKRLRKEYLKKQEEAGKQEKKLFLGYNIPKGKEVNVSIAQLEMEHYKAQQLGCLHDDLLHYVNIIRKRAADETCRPKGHMKTRKELLVKSI